MMSFSESLVGEQLRRESKRYCEGRPPTAATWNGCGFPDANRRWGHDLLSGQRFYADRRPDTRTSRTWRTACRRRTQISRGTDISCAHAQARGCIFLTWWTEFCRLLSPVYQRFRLNLSPRVTQILIEMPGANGSNRFSFVGRLDSR